jgi:hypothetical protein
MRAQDGFIVSIFNYCDRWCETCAFTSRCRLFADMAEHEAALDPTLTAVADAPLLPQEMPPPPPKWLEELIEQMNVAASTPMTQQDLERLEPRISAEHRVIHERARAYCLGMFDWLSECDQNARRNATDPIAVIEWFATLNASKIHRALAGLAEDDGDRELPPDHEGSAKIALIGIERSHAAWLQLVSAHRVAESTARPWITELEWLRARLDEVFPNARAFVRPGFDEPAAVARLMARID